MPNEFNLATWPHIAELEQLWVQEREAEVAAKSEAALNEVYAFISSIGLDALTDEHRAIAAILCILGNQPSSADAFLAMNPEPVELYIRNSEKCQNWAGILLQRLYWRSEVTASGYVAPLVCDVVIQEFWRGNVDVTAAGEAVCKSASGTCWDAERNFMPEYFAGLFMTAAALEHWSDEQKVAAYQRTWNLFQWFIAWGSFTEFTAALQALEAEE